MKEAERRLVHRIAKDTARLISINEKELKPIMRTMGVLLDDLLWEHHDDVVDVHTFTKLVVIELERRGIDGGVSYHAGWNSELHEIE